MRGSDVVDILLRFLPKSWVHVGLVLLFVVMALTHWYEPITWYVFDKAQGLTERLLPLLLERIESLATPPGP